MSKATQQRRSPLGLFADKPKPRLYDSNVEVLRVRHYSRRTEEAYVHWIRRYIEFHQRYFSADCFNKAWELIEKLDRTPAEDEQMIRLSQASLWHWTQRNDCKSENLSIGYWQASRIHAILGRADDARRYGRLCLENTPIESPFLRAYAYEALARAENTAGNSTMVEQYRGEVLRHAESVNAGEFLGDV